MSCRPEAGIDLGPRFFALEFEVGEIRQPTYMELASRRARAAFVVCDRLAWHINNRARHR